MKMSLSSLEVEEEGQQQELPTFGQGETFSNPSSSASEDAIQKVVNLFRRNVKGKAPELSGYNSKHDGKRGHWLEKQMGISHNSQNKADLFGFEMKDDSKSKTTFGDWSADYYIFNDPQFAMTRDDFLRWFGQANESKEGRYSWSGKPCPNIRGYNSFGQKLAVDAKQTILAKYSFSRDAQYRSDTLPLHLQQEDLVLARWESASLKQKLKKFSKGWFKCLRDDGGSYYKIVFGGPIAFNDWIRAVESGDVYFDSGMFQGNPRPYSQWRASNSFWDSLIIAEYQ